MKKPFTHLTLPICAIIVFTGAWWAGAGDLNPPPGAITPTMKTLAEVEPRIAINATNTPGDAGSLFRITQPGSYYLTGNLTGVSGRNGILIAADDVTLDLNGFALIGVPGSTQGISFVGKRNVAIRNGTVRNWDGAAGVWGSVATNSLLEDLRLSDNAGSGLAVSQGNTVIACLALGNGTFGIATAGSCTVKDCTARDNGIDGINVTSRCTVIACTATGNGDDGIVVLTGSTITTCTASSNTGNGIEVGTGSTVTGCTASSNTVNGISTNEGCRVVDCTASSNTVDGIDAGFSSAVTNCTARNNGDDGIIANTGVTVTNCTASANTDDGIVVVSDARVVGNTCDSNGGDGISVLGSGARIEGNNVTDNENGLNVINTPNIIIKNTASGNLVEQYSILGCCGSGVGAIRTNPNGAGPWDNFSF